MPDDAIQLLPLSACLALGLVVVFFRRGNVRSGQRAVLVNVLPVLGFVLLRVFC